MGIMGYNNIALSGTSTASYTLPTYINFYLMLDVSGSMSFPSTDRRAGRLLAVNPDNYGQYPSGCTFACHFTSPALAARLKKRISRRATPRKSTREHIRNPSPGGYCQGYTISRLGTTPAACTSTTNCSNITPSDINWTNTQISSCSTDGTTSCIQLRADAVGYAVTQLLTIAAIQRTGDQSVPGRTLSVHSISLLVFSADHRSDRNGFRHRKLCGNPISPAVGHRREFQPRSGGTHFENAFPSMNSLISSVGTGASSSSTLPYVFLITDGVENTQTYPPFNGSNPQVFDTSLCTTLKNRGITIAILYIPYQPIQNPDHFRRQRRHQRQRAHSAGNERRSQQPSDLRLAAVSIYREHADGHQQRIANDVR